MKAGKRNGYQGSSWTWEALPTHGPINKWTWLGLFLTTFGELSFELTQISFYFTSYLSTQLWWTFSIPASSTTDSDTAAAAATATRINEWHRASLRVESLLQPSGLVLPGPGPVMAPPTPQPSFYYQTTAAKAASSQPLMSTPLVHRKEVSPPPLPVHWPTWPDPPLTLERWHITAVEGIISSGCHVTPATSLASLASTSLPSLLVWLVAFILERRGLPVLHWEYMIVLSPTSLAMRSCSMSVFIFVLVSMSSLPRRQVATVLWLGFATNLAVFCDEDPSVFSRV